MIDVVDEVQVDPVAISRLAEMSHGRMESIGPGYHRLSCDYCGRVYARDELEDVGMGVFMCRACRTQVDAATRTGILSFWQLLDFRLLSSAPAASGAPVAVSVCPAPFSGLTHPGTEPWWDTQADADLSSTLSWCVEALVAWLERTPPDSRWTLKP